MKITEIYNKYKIPPNLQLHQLKVAGVAKTICDSFDKKLDKDSVITACLLHDMGNIIKFDLGKFPEFLEPKGLGYWQKVKDEFIAQYGIDEHQATYKIAKEIRIDKSVYKIINAFGFSKYEENFRHSGMEEKISAYSDHRVKPLGISSLQSRIDDLRKRYNVDEETSDEIRFFETCASYAQKVEQQIFEHCKIRSEDITDEKVNPLVEELKRFEI